MALPRYKRPESLTLKMNFGYCAGEAFSPVSHRYLLPAVCRGALIGTVAQCLALAVQATPANKAALERHYLDDKKTQMIDDPLGEYLDVLGVNEYVGWYDGLPEKMEGMEWKYQACYQ